MKLLSKEESDGLKEITYTFESEHGKLIYKEWVDHRGKVQDEMLLDENGNCIDDPAITEEVEAEVEKLYKE